MMNSRPSTWVFIFLLSGLILAIMASLMLGSIIITPLEVLTRGNALLHGTATGDTVDRILVSVRLPRTMLAILVGAALSLAGLASQTLFRNPLATPYVLGISGGSALGAVIAMLCMGSLGLFTFAAIPAFSIGGGLLVTVMVYGASLRSGSFTHTLLLAGIAVGALCSSLTAGSLFLAGERLQSLVFWMMGGLWPATWNGVLLILPVVLFSLVILILLAPAMNGSLIGDRSARDLGINVARLQQILLVIIAINTAVAVSLTGIIGFIGLIVPHLLRLVLGFDHRRLVPASAIGGGLLLLGADLMARTLASPQEIPVGIFTSLVGSPVFLWLLLRKDAGRSSL